MNIKRFVLASVAVLITLFVLEYLIHGIWLRGIYQGTASAWRPETEIQARMFLMWLGYLIFTPVFVTIYSKGYEKGKPGFGQGLRYGVLMGLLFSPMSALSWYTVLPIPGLLGFYWFIGMMAEMLACGIVAGLAYQPD